jgi:hypothetical protein
MNEYRFEADFSNLINFKNEREAYEITSMSVNPSVSLTNPFEPTGRFS